ncbi:protoporphyrinogen oxidase [Paenibacillus sp. YPG26]|uniref:protoporphyrinogen oxidase n=1 Tax=Paenibacillus sp. YPG26 TaxID=2878915 RepID=UPI00203FFAE7|nr:protoporphyrinogen oxidase [Paenibacillus sp. YPG26]USB31726.1 protoporphyrinogen oxidase [Paenibacillus sp. YPG26]
MCNNVPRIAVIGGGISGLSAAYYLKTYFEKAGRPLELTIMEKSNELGGKIRTIRQDGYIIERGPDSFIGRKAAALRLAQSLGLESELTGTNPAARTNYILHRGKLRQMPAGLALGIPTKVGPFITTDLISIQGKARAAMDLILPRRRGKGDEALGDFIERRIGKEVLERLVEPLLAGIYAGDTSMLSLQSTFPQFHEIESRYRSLILGMMAGRTAASSAASSGTPEPARELPEIAKRSMFLTFKKGLSTLIEKLESELSSAAILKGCAIESIRREGDLYQIRLDTGESYPVDAVILAVPAFACGKLLDGFGESEAFGSVPYVSVANVALGYKASEIRTKLTGSGFVIPRSEGRLMTACTWTSFKWLHTAPEDKILLRAYIGRAGAEADVNMGDLELTRKVREELTDIMGITAEPELCVVSHMPESMPQYRVGHKDRISSLRTVMSVRYPGVLICGSGYDGVGIPDCISQGEQAAKVLSDRLLAQ